MFRSKDKEMNKLAQKIAQAKNIPYYIVAAIGWRGPKVVDCFSISPIVVEVMEKIDGHIKQYDINNQNDVWKVFKIEKKLGKRSKPCSTLMIQK